MMVRNRVSWGDRVVATNIVRVGIAVTRSDGGWRALEYRMFWCRQKDSGPEDMVRSWAEEVISSMDYFCGNNRELLDTLKDGQAARYWVTLRLVGTKDYWGEYDDYIEILKCHRIR